MLIILRNEKRTHFSNVITGDESWFLYEYCQSSQYVLSKDDHPSHCSQKVKDYIENSEFRKMPHLAYSPDVTPSDFNLFGTMKERLIGIEHNSEKSLKSHILKIPDEFEPDFWQSLLNS